MADHEIRIHPTVNLQEIQHLERHLEQVRQQMDRIAGSAAKITIPSASPGQPPRTVAEDVQAEQRRRTQGSQRVVEAQNAAMPPAGGSARRGRPGRQSATGENARTPGGLLNWIMSVFLPDQPTIQEMTHSTSPISPHHLLRARNTQSVLGRSRQLQQASGNNLNRTATAAAQIAAEEGLGPLDQYGLRQSAERVQQWHQGPGRFAAYHAYHQRAVQAAAAKAGGSGGSGQGSRRLGAGPRAMLNAAGIGGATEMLSTLGPWAAAAVAVDYGQSKIRQGWSAYRTQGTAFSALSQAMGNLGESFNTLRDQANAVGTAFAESLPTITQVTQTYLPYVGNLSPRRLTTALNASQGLAFSYGLNPVTTTQAFGQAAQMGITATGGSTGQMTPPQWAALIANATAQGQMQGRTGQVLASMLSVSQNIAQQIAQAPNQNILAGIMTAMNRSGNAMLQGTNGAALLNNLNSGITQPGSGAAGELFTLQALNSNRQLSYWQTRYLQAQGLSGVNPTTHLTNFAAELQAMYKMLPGGKVTGTTVHGIWMPSTQTAAVGGMLGSVMHLTQPQMLQVLKAFQGQRLTAINKTEELANRWGGPNALQTLLHKGGINVFGQIANATNVHQLTATANTITKNLHGTIAKSFTTTQKQYEALGKTHPTSLKQAEAISHQRALDFQAMQKTLGQSVLHGPQLMTPLQRLNQTIAATQKNWTKIADNIQPLASATAKLAEAVSTPGKTTMNLLNRPPGTTWTEDFMHWISGGRIPLHANQKPFLHPHASARTSAYQPWIGTPSTATPSAQLADFVMGNMQAAANLPFQSSSNQNGNNNGGAILASLQIGGQSNPSGTGVRRWGPNISDIISHLPNRSALLTPGLVEAVMHQESGGQQYWANGQVKQSSAGALGLMQLEPGTAASLGVNPNNPIQNLAGGILYLNQQLQKFGNVQQALSAYNAGPGAVPANGIDPATAQYVRDILAELKYLNSQISNGTVQTHLA